MRLLLIALSCIVLAAVSIRPALAASVYDDVPTTDCAYDALSRLTAQGVLTDYPVDFFDGSRTVTRYEFAQAVVRLLDVVQRPATAETVRTTADCLRREFADDIAALDQTVQQAQQDCQEQTADCAAMGTKLDAIGGRLTALEKTLAANRNNEPQWSGDFTYRMRFDARQGGLADTGLTPQARLRLAYRERLSDELEVNIGLSTAGSFGADRFAPFGDGFASPQVDLDHAYVHYTPDWAGSYRTAAEGSAPKLELWQGIIPAADR